MHAKKQFGQHFLSHTPSAESIAEAAMREAENWHNNLLEVGPGKAAISNYFLQNPKLNFIAVEADRDMMEFLTTRYPDRKSSFIQKDILDMSFEGIFNNQEFVLCGNFPYNISSQIVIKVLDNVQRIPAMIGMFQKEVADRILSPPGSKAYGGISAITQLLYTGSKILQLPPAHFTPPPKVHSTVIALQRRETLPDPVVYQQARVIIRHVFLYRRKMLRTSLRNIISDHSILEDKYFDLRPEQLEPEAYLRLAELVTPHLKK